MIFLPSAQSNGFLTRVLLRIVERRRPRSWLPSLTATPRLSPAPSGRKVTFYERKKYQVSGLELERRMNGGTYPDLQHQWLDSTVVRQDNADRHQQNVKKEANHEKRIEGTCN